MLRNFEGNISELQEMLATRPWSGVELQAKFGNSYVSLVRKVNGESLARGEGGIWIDKAGSGTIYSRVKLTRDYRCRRCHAPLGLDSTSEWRMKNPYCGICARRISTSRASE
jgi:hypothetical protein